MEHTQETWFVGEYSGFYYIQDGEKYGSINLLDEEECARAKANAERIICCVNAMAGLSNKQVEKLRESYADMTELLKAIDYGYNDYLPLFMEEKILSAIKIAEELLK